MFSTSVVQRLFSGLPRCEPIFELQLFHV
jgi:hypothetical protein